MQNGKTAYKKTLPNALVNTSNVEIEIKNLGISLDKPVIVGFVINRIDTYIMNAANQQDQQALSLW